MNDVANADVRRMRAFFAKNPIPRGMKYDPAAATLAAIQRKVAVSSIPASALRGQRTPGLTRIVRDHLSALPLRQFSVSTASLFSARLNATTDELLTSLPRKVRRWGVARKAMNLFLRDAFYNQFLAAHYRLNKAAAFYELPLDSITALAVDDHDDEWDLPRWRGLLHLPPEASSTYQLAASDMAAEFGCVRAHLDAFIWAAPR